MMSLDEIETVLTGIVANRTGTGGYDVNAGDMLFFAQTLLIIVRRLQSYETDTRDGSL